MPSNPYEYGEPEYDYPTEDDIEAIEDAAYHRYVDEQVIREVEEYEED